MTGISYFELNTPYRVFVPNHKKPQLIVSRGFEVANLYSYCSKLIAVCQGWDCRMSSSSCCSASILMLYCGMSIAWITNQATKAPTAALSRNFPADIKVSLILWLSCLSTHLVIASCILVESLHASVKVFTKLSLSPTISSRSLRRFLMALTSRLCWPFSMKLCIGKSLRLSVVSLSDIF